jgi:hypothetical protein
MARTKPNSDLKWKGRSFKREQPMRQQGKYHTPAKSTIREDRDRAYRAADRREEE